MDRNSGSNDRIQEAPRAGRRNDSKRVLSTKRILSRSTEEGRVGEEDRVRSESVSAKLETDYQGQGKQQHPIGFQVL